jgi:four helix bundle protein
MNTVNRPILTHKDLDAWKISCDLAKEIYILTSKFPKSELFSLVDQMRRASISIPSNIAEGYGRWSRGDYLRHCHIAYGSLAELETQILLSKDLKMANINDFKVSDELILRIQKILNKLIKSLRS